MKHIRFHSIRSLLLYAAVLLSAFCILLCTSCTPGVRWQVQTLHTTKPAPRPLPSPNVSVSQLAVVAFYPDSDTQFSIHRQGRFTVVELDGNSPREIPAEVYETLPGTFVADFGCGDFLKIYTTTGISHIQYKGINRTYNFKNTSK